MLERKIKPSVPIYAFVDFFNTEKIPTGQFVVSCDGAEIDVMFEDSGYSDTVIFFHASLGSKIERLPVFSGSNFSKGIKANRLFISDPSLNIHPELRLAWYAGCFEFPNAQSLITRVINKLTGRHRTIYFGASGGGFASLYYSSRDSGSLAIPVNPQTDIFRYNENIVSRWFDHCWKSNSVLMQDSSVVDLCKLYGKELDNRVLYVQNINDVDHYELHYLPFIDQSSSRNLIQPLLVDGAAGHVPPSNEQLREILDFVLSCPDWNTPDFFADSAEVECSTSPLGEHQFSGSDSKCIYCDVSSEMN